MIINIMQNIQQEYHSNIGKFSKGVIIAQLELLLIYSERFYNRHFITRKISNYKILEKLESFLADYFNNEHSSQKGLPYKYLCSNPNAESV